MHTNHFHLSDPWLKCPATLHLEALPEDMQRLVLEIQEEPDQLSAVRHAYEVLGQKYRGYRVFTFLRLDRFFIHSLKKLWQLHGFLHCNHMNYLLRTVLVASGKFAPDDIEACWTQIWLFSPHQYLVVHLHDGKKLEVDLWGKQYGIHLGDHAHGFHGKTILKSI